jgi:hypothetical protein
MATNRASILLNLLLYHLRVVDDLFHCQLQEISNRIRETMSLVTEARKMLSTVSNLAYRSKPFVTTRQYHTSLMDSIANLRQEKQDLELEINASANSICNIEALLRDFDAVDQ